MTVTWITAFLDRPRSADDAATAFWTAATGWSESPRRGPTGAFSTLLPETGDPYVRLQRTDDDTAGTHLDLHTADPAALADRAIGLGADLLATEGSLHVLRSPGGLAFCTVAGEGEPVAPSHGDVAGAPGLVDVVCVDAPAPRHAAELDFWSALTGWDAAATPFEEFVALPTPDGLPVSILIQRLDEPDGPVRAHVDVRAHDIDAEVARHVALGATAGGRHPRWVVMTDPTGAPYCLHGG